MLISPFLEPTQYGSYLAFLFACVVIMYENLTHLHHRPEIMALSGLLLLCGGFLYKDNPGLFVLLLAGFLQSIKLYLLTRSKSQALP